MKFDCELKKNKALLKERLKSADIKFDEITIGDKDALYIYVDSLTDRNALSEYALLPMKQIKTLSSTEDVSNVLFASEINKATDSENSVKEILDGKTLFLFDGLEEGLTVDFKKFDMRQVSEPPTASVIKGPREGFNESIKSNLGLLRRRIKSEKLVVETMETGKYPKTSVAICYIDNIMNKGILKTIKDRLNEIDIDAIPDSSYLSKYLASNKTSLFKQINTTEKPDVFAMRIIEGRVGILVDGTPIAITAPYLLVEDFQSAEDYYSNNYHANIIRIIRIVSIMVAAFLPGFFVAAQLFHLQFIPLDFLLTIINGIKGIPLSPSFEMFFTLLIFEILNEASIRMPKYVGQALSIVGALVLGEMAVRAGIVSTPAILIMALSGIALYTVPELVESMSVLRIIFLIIAGSVGAYGLILAITFIIAYLTSLENFGVPITAPFAPLIKDDLKDSLYLGFIMERKTRPKVFDVQNKTRLKNKYRGKREK